MSDASNEELQRELIKDFIIESVEGLDLFDRELLDFEAGGDLETMNVIFRVIHTIKGTAGCLALSNIERVAHVGENLLSSLREGEIESDKEMITSLLELSDALKDSIRILEETGVDEKRDNSKLLMKLEAYQSGESGSAAAWGLFEGSEDAGSGVAESSSQPEGDAGAGESQSEPGNAVSLTEKPSSGKASIAEGSIRVGVAQLDKVMNMVGELVLARNQIVVNTTNFDEAALMTASQRLNIITTELQESVMKTRMQPIGSVWSKFPRVVRDVAGELGKQVRLIMDGQDTELDRTVVEAIKDPLTHIVRNSIDHGIELPEVRAAAGKSKEGFLSLRSYHEGGQIIIEIMDDGAGIDVARVKKVAIDRDLISGNQAEKLSDREAIGLIFLPGFSTAGKVSNVSGRGVGMDVVKTNIEKAGGTIDVSTDPGQGTTLKIKIPLTLAIIPALIVSTGGDRYAIPQASLLELVRLEGAEALAGIENLYGSPVYRLRGELLPIVFLNEELEIAAAQESDSSAAEEDRVLNIVVLQADGRQFGLVVDTINDTEEIVVKPLGKQLKGINCFAGATIMGDGKVALILDVLGIAQKAKVVSESPERALAAEESSAGEGVEGQQTFLLFTVGDSRRMAIELSEAARLEEFAIASVESAGGKEVVQYRDAILPLIRIGNLFGIGEGGSVEESLQVVVCSNGGCAYGFVVSSIQDIVSESVSVSRKSGGRGIDGSMVIQGKVTDLIDVSAVIELFEGSYQEAIGV